MQMSPRLSLSLLSVLFNSNPRDSSIITYLAISSIFLLSHRNILLTIFRMSSTSDRIMDDKASQHTPTSQQHPLERQMTLTLNTDQYERLFFQPSPPKGDLAKRFGMPPFPPYTDITKYTHKQHQPSLVSSVS